MHRTVGIDPGNSGGFCVITEFDDGTSEFHFTSMPIIRSVTTKANKKKTSTQLDYFKLAEIFETFGGATVFLEKVSAMPGQGVVSMFNFGMAFGSLKALLHAYKLKHYETTPQAWQKVMHEGVSKDLDAKARSLVVYRRLFPNLNLIKEGCKFPDEGYIDALLIAEYGRRTRG